MPLSLTLPAQGRDVRCIATSPLLRSYCSELVVRFARSRDIISEVSDRYVLLKDVRAAAGGNHRLFKTEALLEAFYEGYCGKYGGTWRSYLTTATSFNVQRSTCRTCNEHY
ncbi:hypothetical protein WOLCODRAFT_22480 [Wolfiporia cocos MD-104 SS10]|uniref:Uncharacterized protein n=1 Tax=Wolfiporia cocos (strain MD-104) TaxID=742152 RepID=A0A2H3J2Y4_WOLCO|nr:hypothetical protein WOLCODRAFT_22480 [Wolfiporia cocos MD-104 SS10]